MAKVLFIGDPHIKINKFNLGLQFLSWLDSIIKNQKPDIVVNLGDFFDTHAVLRSEIMTEFMNHVNATVSKGIPYVYLLGNHDCFRPNDSKYHALTHLKNTIKNFYIVDSTTNLFDMTFVPYTHNPDDFPKSTLPICIAHQTFKGADYGDIVTQEGVDQAAIEGVEIIISGHIHKKQVLGKVIYPGSPFSQNANDVDQVKGLLLFDTDTYQETFIQCHLPMWRRLTYELSPDLTISDITNSIYENLLDTKDHWIIDITGPKAEILTYLNSNKTKDLFLGKDVRVKTTFTDKEKRQVNIDAISMEHIVSEYIDKIYSGNLDKSALKAKTLDILQKARKISQ